MANRKQALKEATLQGLQRINKRTPKNAEDGTEKKVGSKNHRSLSEGWAEEQRRQLKEQGRLVGRPRSDKKKVRVNFSLDEEDVVDLKNLATIKNTTLSNLVRDCLHTEFDKFRRDLDMMIAMQGRR